MKQIIEQRLKELEAVFQTYSRCKKTETIKRLFAGLFTNTNYSIYANKMGDESKWHLITDEQEWLFDLIVLETEKSEHEKIPFMTKTILTLESEFDGKLKAVVDDFQKLLTSNSDYKVMVFHCHSEEFESWTSYMETNIQHHKKANGVFYIISFLNDLNVFRLKEIIVSDK